MKIFAKKMTPILKYKKKKLKTFIIQKMPVSMCTNDGLKPLFDNELPTSPLNIAANLN
jgi:hypothetical protein